MVDRGPSYPKRFGGVETSGEDEKVMVAEKDDNTMGRLKDCRTWDGLGAQDDLSPPGPCPLSVLSPSIVLRQC